MELTGKQKSAMLLMTLDPMTAAELLKGVDDEVIQELAVELAYLDASGFRNSKQSAEIARQFCDSLQSQEFHLKSFLDEMLKSTVGKEKSKQIQTQIQNLLQKRDPFMTIRSANAQVIASILNNEHPQAVAVVLSELSPKKSSEVLGLLGEGVRLSAVSRMTGSELVTAEAKARIAESVSNRFKTISAAGEGAAAQAGPERSLRKLAVILRNLGKELRDGMLGEIQKKDSSVAEKVTELMILWEDIAMVTDKSLQEALRGVDSQKLALALTKADETINQKIRTNISERAAAAVDEETSLMSSPKKEDIKQAREEIVKILREMNEKGELAFVEE